MRPRLEVIIPALRKLLAMSITLVRHTPII
jgi:hypothetical protein